MKWNIATIVLLIASLILFLIGVQNLVRQCEEQHICSIHLRNYYTEMRILPKKTPFTPETFTKFLENFTDKSAIQCPSIAVQENFFSYQVLDNSLPAISSKKIAIAWDTPITSTPLTTLRTVKKENRHYGRCNILFSDGEVQSNSQQ